MLQFDYGRFRLKVSFYQKPPTNGILHIAAGDNWTKTRKMYEGLMLKTN